MKNNNSNSNEIEEDELLNILKRKYPDKVVKVQFLHNYKNNQIRDDFDIIAVLLVRNVRDDDLK